MSMGLSNTSAQEVVNNLCESQLKLIIKILGEEKEASKIAKNIVRERFKKKITRVDELVKIIEKSKTKFFLKLIQALKRFKHSEYLLTKRLLNY